MKKLYLSLLLLASVSCTVNPVTLTDKPANFSELEQEYRFQNKALTQNYLKNKITNWINNDGVKLVKELEFARVKGEETVPFKALITSEPELLTDINAVEEVIAEKAGNAPFRLFIDGPGNKASCKEHYDNGSTTNGTYTIDPDGPDNGVAPFDVYCNMTGEGGGWTLVAYHTDNINPVEKAFVDKSAYGVMQAARWIAVRNTLSTGMMFIDENSKVSRISKTKLETANCKNIHQENNLSDGNHLIHNERGCSGTGTDYSVITLRNYSNAGAALYQYSDLKFDLWPYYNNFVSYDEQNILEYYLK